MKSEVYLNFIRFKPCMSCGAAGPNDPHHVRMSGNAGIGCKPTDFMTVPLCRDCHNGLQNDKHFLDCKVFDGFKVERTMYQSELLAVKMCELLSEFLETLHGDLDQVLNIFKGYE